MGNFFRRVLSGVVIGAAVGLWLGFNLGRDAPLLANPFESHSVTAKTERKAEELYQRGEDAVRESGEKLKRQLDSP